MQLTGKLLGISKDWITGKLRLTFEVEECVSADDLTKIKGFEKLSLKVSKFRKRRSLDANAYLWVLLSKMANVLHKDKWEVYLDMLARYGVFTHIIVKPNVVDKVKAEWRAAVELGSVKVNGKEGTQLQCYFGSSTYDSKEMSVLLDGVITEAKELGITTETPDEIERMKQQWANY